MNYSEWEQDVPADIRGDGLWKMEVYRLALFLSDLAWHDATKLAQDRRTLGLSDQLYRAIGSIGANVAEGYSRSSGKDRYAFTSIPWDRAVRAAMGITRAATHSATL
jgi:four helix bundle protein